jgi:preprotein translocase subunit SecF
VEQFEVSKAGADQTALAVHVENVTAEGVAPLRAELEQALKAKYPSMDETNVQVRFESADAGAALRGNGIFLMILAGLLMFGYIYFRYDFSFAMAALFGLVHDVLIMLSLMVILRSFVNLGDQFTVAVFAVIFASTLYSAAVFRRVMENRKALRHKALSIVEVAEKSIKESKGRLIGIALPLLLMLVTLAIIGTGDARAFAWPAAIGILSGLYGALFINGYIWALMESNSSSEKEKAEKA